MLMHVSDNMKTDIVCIVKLYYDSLTEQLKLFLEYSIDDFCFMIKL